MISKEPVNHNIAELVITENLTGRTKNVCVENSLDNLFAIIEFYITFGNFRALQRCGIKTNNELTNLCKKYIVKYGIAKEAVAKNVQSRQFNSLAQYSIERFHFTTRRINVFYPLFEQRQFPFFRFSLIALRRELSPREFFILAHNFDFFINKRKLTLQEIGEQYGITRERSRQILRDTSNKLRKFLSSVCNDLSFLRDHVYYPITIRKDYMLIDQTSANAINKQENLRCTPRFYALLLAFLHQESYHFFQDLDRKSKNYYLVNRKLASTFDFGEFLYQLRSISNTKIKESYTINLATFISTFYRPGKFEAPERIHSICAEIANEEFGYITNSEGLIAIDRNTNKRLPEHVAELLKEIGRPMSLREIAHTLRKRNIKTPATIGALRSSLLVSRKFIAIGKTSTYSLKEWQNIKTGTIRNLAIEFLEKRPLPAHLNEIASYIMSHRNTKPQLIFDNLKVDSQGIFKFFPKKYIGLSNKDYPPQWTTNPQLSLL